MLLSVRTGSLFVPAWLILYGTSSTPDSRHQGQQALWLWRVVSYGRQNSSYFKGEDFLKMDRQWEANIWCQIIIMHLLTNCDLHIVESLQIFASLLESLVFVLRNSRDLCDYYAFGPWLHIKVCYQYIINIS